MNTRFTAAASVLVISLASCDLHKDPVGLLTPGQISTDPTLTEFKVGSVLICPGVSKPTGSLCKSQPASEMTRTDAAAVNLVFMIAPIKMPH